MLAEMRGAFFLFVSLGFFLIIIGLLALGTVMKIPSGGVNGRGPRLDYPSKGQVEQSPELCVSLIPTSAGEQLFRPGDLI